VHATRIALRNQMRGADLCDRLRTIELSPEQTAQLVKFAASAPVGPMALLVFDEALDGNVDDDLLGDALPTAARFVDVTRIERMVEHVKKRFPSNSALQIELLRGLGEGLFQQGLPLTEVLQATLTELIAAALEGENASSHAELYRIAGQLKLNALTDTIIQAAGPTNADFTSRLAATEALVMLAPERAIDPLAAVLADASAPTSARELAAQQLGSIDDPDARAVLLEQLTLAPGSVAVLIAAALAGYQDSAAALLHEIANGRASAELLREPTVADRLASSRLAELDKKIRELTSDLSPADSRIGQLISQRRASFLADSHDAEAGRQVFAKSVCAKCHRIGEVGSTIGPALDGIGHRGLDRLLEDTLDPNRNVDAAFRSEIIETEDGRILTGFGLRDDGETRVFHKASGEQVRLLVADVSEHKQSALSPMPANIIEQIPESDFNALLACLLSLQKN
jgi:putative heme-binding domain-containing protein